MLEYHVSYEDVFLDKMRSRVFHDLSEAMQFVEFRLLMPGIYNNINISVVAEDKKEVG